MSYQETISKLRADKAKLNELQDRYIENKLTLNVNELYFIIENIGVNFDRIIEDLEQL